MFTEHEIRRIALKQSAIDCHCRPEDFDASENVVVVSQTDPRCRRYLQLPFTCQLVSYGSNVVASVQPELADSVRAYIDRLSPERAFETPQIYRLNDLLRPWGSRVCFMASYFLPVLPPPDVSSSFCLRVLGPSDFAALYTPEWSNALCEKRRELDVLGVGAYDGARLVGLAACSADCDTMWQIGVDVLPDYRRQGIAAAVTSRLAREILARDKVPFYCAAWSNIKSIRNALRSGFRPAWVELTAKGDAFVETLLNETLGEGCP